MGDEEDETVSEIDKLRIEFEANLFQQEHRLFVLLRNFFVRRHEFAHGDPRVDAIRNALIWRIVIAMAPSTAAAGIGVTAIVGLYIAYQANGLLGKQNGHIEDQNTFFQEQNTVIQEQLAEQQKQFEKQQKSEETALRATLIETLYAQKNVPSLFEAFGVKSAPTPVANVRARSEALAAFVAIERKRIYESGSSGIVDLRHSLLHDVNLQSPDLTDVLLTDVLLPKADLTGAKLRWANLAGADLTGAKLIYADLSCADLTGAKLMQADLSGADLRIAKLAYADLAGADLTSAKLIHADLSGADLSGAKLSGAELSGAKVFTRDWIKSTDDLMAWTVVESKEDGKTVLRLQQSKVTKE